jgi:hypothetical protein
MKKFLAVGALLLASIASACGLIYPTNVNGIVWQDCDGQVAVGNQGPAVVQVNFTVFYATGGYGQWIVDIAPHSFVVEPTAGPVSGVVVNTIRIP